MAMKNPPRRTTIRGQKHLLAYITPEEAALLKAMGGSGEKVNGIPAYPGGFGGEGMGGFGGMAGGGESASGETDAGWGRSEDADAAAAAAQAAQEAADQGIDAETDDPTTAGWGSTEYDPNVSVFGTPEADRNWVERALVSRLQNKGLKGFVGLERDDLGRVTGYTTQANPLGTLGLLTSIFDLNPTVYTGFGKGAGFSDGPDGAGPETIPATYNPVTGEAQCPDGYMFDEDLQACRLAGGLPGGDGQVMTTSGPYEAGDYARMGLLDVAPVGMGLFAQRYGAGFGTPSDFSTANLAFRRGAATRPQYFKQAPDLTGYTLLS